MKPLYYLILLLSCFACQEAGTDANLLIASTENFDEEAELAAIMKVVENETACFFARDYDCWKENWVDEDYAFQAWSNSDGTYAAKVGWSEIDRQISKYIRENPASGDGSIQSFSVERLNLRKRFYGDNVAHLTWEQFNSDAAAQTYRISQEVRLLEKVDGQWKLVNVSAFWDYKNKVLAGSFDS